MPRSVNKEYAINWALTALAALSLGWELSSPFAFAQESAKGPAIKSSRNVETGETPALPGPRTTTPARIRSVEESAIRIKASKNDAKPDRVQVQLVSISTAETMLKAGGVFIFFDPSCPICAEYFPTIENLTNQFPERTFRLIMRAGEFDLAEKFAAEYKPKCELIVDEESQLKKKLSARVTPQSFLVEPGGTVTYSGRIDDRYKALGQRRSVIGSKDLEAALLESSKHMKITNAVTDPVGCFLE